MPNHVVNVQHSQAGAGTDYEYESGSYSALLDKQLAAIKNKAELEEKKSKEEGPLGTRNMAILNTALAGRNLLEQGREKYVMGKIKDLGGIGKKAKFIDDAEYQAMSDEDKGAFKQSEDGQWVSGNWDYDKSKGFWSDVGRAVTGWQAGVHEVAEKGMTMDDMDNGKIQDVVSTNVAAATNNQDVDADGNNVADPVTKDVVDAATNEPSIPFVSKKETLSPATASLDDADTDPDIKPDVAWEDIDDKKDKKSMFSWLAGPSMYAKDAEPRWNTPNKKSDKTVQDAVVTLKDKAKAKKELEMIKSEGKMEQANRKEALDKKLVEITGSTTFSDDKKTNWFEW